MELTARVRRDDGSHVVLVVECDVWGRWRAPRLDGPPELCHDGEAPEIEPRTARWEAIEDRDGEAREPGEGESDAFLLRDLSSDEWRRLLDALYEALAAWEDDRDYDRAAGW